MGDLVQGHRKFYLTPEKDELKHFHEFPSYRAWQADDEDVKKNQVMWTLRI